jgi:predicted outer membrane repeat protein
MRHIPSQRALLEELEPRILYSADAAAVLGSGMGGLTSVASQDQQLLSNSSVASQTAASAYEIAFVDLSAPDAQALVMGLNAQRDNGRPIHVITIAPDEDGIEVISRTLANQQGVSAVHVIGHGSDGRVMLGSAVLDNDSALARAGELAEWSWALTPEADLLIYGCDVAAGANGLQLINALAALVGADVAASEDATGAAQLGGDWQLEQRTGSVETHVAADEVLQAAWGGLLSNDIAVNTITTDAQNTSAEHRGSQQSVALDSAGNYVVVWTSQNQDGAAGGVYARRFAFDGTPLTGEILVNNVTAGDQGQARVVSAADGSFAVAWTSHGGDGSAQGIALRFFNVAGNAVSTEIVVNTSTSGAQLNPTLAINASTGAVVVAWEGNGAADNSGVFFRRFASNGTAIDAAEIQANVTDAGSEIGAAVAMDSSGRVVVAFEQGSKVYFQRFDSAGVAQGGLTPADPTGAGANTLPAIAMAPDGHFVVIYREANFIPGVWGRGFNADGTQRFSSFNVGTGDASDASVDMDALGNFIVTYNKTNGSDTDIYARKFNANGAANGAAFVVNQHTTGVQAAPSVAMLARNDFVVAWSGVTAADTAGIAARSFEGVAPVITSNGGGTTASANVAENATAVTSVTATDADAGTTLSYSIAGGADAALFSINASTGALVFNSAPNFEAPAGASANNTYEVVVMASDELRNDSQTITVNVTPVNEFAPVITSSGGGASASLSMAENGIAVVMVQATDADLPAPSMTYIVSGGADAARFTINATTGALAFAATPDFEMPADVGADNVYDVVVEASDGGRSDTMALGITVSDAFDTVDAVDDAATAGHNTPVNIDVLANDLFPSGGTPTVLDFGQAAHGSVSQVGTLLQYSPTTGYAGSDGFSYLASDLSDSLTHYWRLDGNAVDLLGTADGTVVNAPSTTAGHWGNALAFHGVNQHAVLPDLSVANSFSLSLWFRMDDNTGTGYRYLYAHGGAGTQDSVNVFFIEDATTTASGVTNVLRTRLLDGNDTDDMAGLDIPITGLADGQWHQYMLTVGAGTGSAVYIDGGLRSSIGSGGDAINPSGNVIMGGNNTLSGARFFKGGLDSVAIYDQAFSAAEVAKNFADSLGSTDSAAVTLTVNVANDTPVISSNGGVVSAAVPVAEGSIVVTTVQATDAESDPVTYGISGGADAARFSINAVTGELVFVAAPDFETPLDADADNLYVVQVQASDGSSADTQTLNITVTDVGTTLVVDTLADNVDGAVTSTEALLANKGADGKISLREAITAANNTAGTQTIQLGAGTHSITLSGLGDDLNAGDDFDIRDSVNIVGAGSAATVISGAGAYAVLEVVQGTASLSNLTIADGYSLAVGAGIDVKAGATLMLSQAVVRDNVGSLANAAGIENAGNLSLVDVEVRDNAAGLDAGGLRHVGTELHLERVTFAGNSSGTAGGALFVNGASVSISNVTFSGNSALTSGGALYAAVPITLTNVTFANNNSVSGGAAFATAALSVRNTLFANSGSGSFAGSGSLLSLGNNLADDALFALNQASDRPSAVAGLAPLADNGGYGRTHALLVASEAVNGGTGTGAPPTDQRGVARVATVDIGSFESNFSVNAAPVMALPSAMTALEDASTALVGLSVSDPNALEPTPAWHLAQVSLSVAHGSLNLSLAGTAAVSGGALGASSITLSGSQVDLNASLASLIYLSSANYNGADTLTVTVADGSGLSDVGSMAITVQPTNDAPVVSGFVGGLLTEGSTAAATVMASDLDGNTLTYAITGGADSARFVVNASTGRISFVTAPDFEAPADADGDNVYEVQLSASDGLLSDAQTLLVTVTNANEAPVVTGFSGGGALGQAVEGANLVGTLLANDVDGDTPSFSISGGADAPLFSLNASSGTLRFIAVPDFEAPADADGDGVYELVVTASDVGGLQNSQAISVQVLNTDEVPVWLNNRLTIDEGGVASPDVQAFDVDSAATDLQFQVQGLTGGWFENAAAPGVAITSFTQADLNTGGVRFVADGAQGAPAYQLVLADGTNTLQAQQAAVDFTPVNDAPTAGPIDLGASKEDERFVVDAAMLLAHASDVDGDAVVVSGVRIQSGQAALQNLGGGRWQIDPAADWVGAVSLQFEVSDGVAVAASSAQLQVSAVNDAPRWVNPVPSPQASFATSENNQAVAVLAAADVDSAVNTLQFAIAGGADAALFRLDAGTGRLEFMAAPDFEAPQDANADGRYELMVEVSDGQASATQALRIDIVNSDEAPVVTQQALLVSAQGFTLVLQAADPDGAANGLSYEVVSTQGGRFEILSAAGRAAGKFSQADVDAGQVRFVADGSGLQPDFKLALSDGFNRVQLAQPDIVVEAAAPVQETASVIPQTEAAVAEPDSKTALLSAAAVAAPSPAPATSAVKEATVAATAQAPDALLSSLPPLPTLASVVVASTGLNLGSAPAASSAAGLVKADSVAAGAGFWMQTIAALQLAGDESPTQREHASSELFANRNGSSLAQAMDSMRLNDSETQGGLLQIDSGGAVLLSGGLSVGYVLWLARGGALVASLMSSVPAWASVDPLPVLSQARRARDGDDGEAGEEGEEFDPVDRLFSRARRLIKAEPPAQAPSQSLSPGQQAKEEAECIS